MNLRLGRRRVQVSTSFEEAIKKCCKHHDELLEVMGGRASSEPAFTSDEFDNENENDDGSDLEEEDDDGVLLDSSDEEDAPAIPSKKTHPPFDAGAGCSSSSDEETECVPRVVTTGSDGGTLSTKSSSCSGKKCSASSAGKVVKKSKTAPPSLGRVIKKPRTEKGGDEKGGKSVVARKGKKDDETTQALRGILGGSNLQDALAEKAILEEKKFAELQRHNKVLEANILEEKKFAELQRHNKVLEAEKRIELFQKHQAIKDAPWINSASIKSMFPADMADIFIKERAKEAEKNIEKSASSIFEDWPDDNPNAKDANPSP